MLTLYVVTTFAITAQCPLSEVLKHCYRYVCMCREHVLQQNISDDSKKDVWRRALETYGSDARIMIGYKSLPVLPVSITMTGVIVRGGTDEEALHAKSRTCCGRP
eukprot:COSAG01_NODE_661_length_14426_cov_32.272632_12_plen_105_part_00